MRILMSVIIVGVTGFGCRCHSHDPATRPTASEAVAVKAARLGDPLNVNQERRLKMTEQDLEIQKKNEETAAAMKRPMQETDFSGTPLSNAIENLRTTTKLNIFVNWRAMEAAGAKQNLPVTCKLRGLTVEQALHKLLDEVGSEQVLLDYTVDEGVVTVSTREDLAKNTVTRVYDVRSGITSKDPVERQKQVEKIVRVVHGISPLSWREFGGTTGAVRELSGQLIVTATPQTQKRVMEELEQFAGKGSSPLLSSRRD
jgi:hypothetical protein